MRLKALSAALPSVLLAVAVGSVAVTRVARADGTPPSLSEVRSEMEWVRSRGYSPCPTRVDPGVDELVFAFDGAEGFLGSDFVFDFRDPHTGFSGGDVWKNGNSPESDRAELYSRYSKWQSRESGNGALIHALETASEKLDRLVPKKVLYYPWNASGPAAWCAERISRTYAAAGRKLSISAMGFSLGGYSTVLFSRALNWDGLRLKNVLTIDPVPFTLEIVRALGTWKNGTVIRVPMNHDSWLNLFQRGDTDTLDLPSPFGDRPIHGAKLSGGVRNRIPLENDGKAVSNHMDMPGSDVSIAEMVRILED